MPYAIDLFFDVVTEETVRSIWKELAALESAAYLHQSGARPHIKLAVYQTLNLEAVELRLRPLAAAVDTMSVIFKQVGFFPNPRPTVFWGPVVTMPLLELQRQVCQALHAVASDLSTDYFSAGQWVPHCLLAVEAAPEQLPLVLNVAMRLPLPFAGEIQGMGVVEFRPPKHLLNFQLRHPSAG